MADMVPVIFSSIAAPPCVLAVKQACGFPLRPLSAGNPGSVVIDSIFMSISESTTRSTLIDPQLQAAGWRLDDRSLVRFEIPVDGYDAEPWNGVTDYCLYDPSGNVLAVVEAKRCSRNPREADEQLRHYITEIAKRQPYAPFGFMSNGHSTWFWEVGEANPRLVAGFFSPDDLQRLLFLRQNQLPLETTPINPTIVDRPYQHEAIRRVAEAFAAKKRRALLVMATGTGKTRVTMALIDFFLRANQAQKVLFLADRDALVDQALTDGFKAHLAERTPRPDLHPQHRQDQTPVRRHGTDDEPVLHEVQPRLLRPDRFR